MCKQGLVAARDRAANDYFLERASDLDAVLEKLDRFGDEFVLGGLAFRGEPVVDGGMWCERAALAAIRRDLAALLASS